MKYKITFLDGTDTTVRFPDTWSQPNPFKLSDETGTVLNWQNEDGHVMCELHHVASFEAV